MNSKLIAAVAVIALLSAGMAVMASGASATQPAGTNNLGEVYLDSDDTTTGSSVELRYNQSAYENVYHSHTVQMSVAKTTDGSIPTSGYTEFYSTLTANGTAENMVFSAKEPSNGVSTVTVKADTTAPTAGSYEMIIKLEVTVTPKDGATSIPLDPVYYYLKVNVRTNGTISSMSVNAFTSGVNSTQQVNIEGLTKSIDSYDWYATGLPAGLNLAVSGTGNDSKLNVTGMTTGNTADAKVVARDKTTGAEYTGELTVTVNTNDQKITYKLASGGEELSSDNGNYYVEQSATSGLTLEITKPEGFTGTVSVTVIDLSSETLDRVSVTVASSSNTDTYSIPTAGVGTYVIEISYSGDYVMLTLNVIPNATGSGAGVTISGNP